VKYAYLGLWEFYGSITGVPEAPEAHFVTKQGRWLPPSSPRRAQLAQAS